MNINKKTDALIIIDIQNDFCPGGALAVADGDAIVPGVRELARQFDTIILTQDNHPAGHASFASTHGKDPFSTITLGYGEQTMWPDHCVQGGWGAQFHADLCVDPEAEGPGLVDRATAIIRKGSNPAVDSYSAFFENDRETATGLAGLLRERGIERVFLVGLAYDFCVGYSALDARKEGFEAVVIKDLTRAIGMPISGGTTIDLIEGGFEEYGVELANAADIKPAASGVRSGPLR